METVRHVVGKTAGRVSELCCLRIPPEEVARLTVDIRSATRCRGLAAAPTGAFPPTDAAVITNARTNVVLFHRPL